nr:hypothetical protein TCSYLVIO_006561 [Ipomoea batatas]
MTVTSSKETLILSVFIIFFTVFIIKVKTLPNVHHHLHKFFIVDLTISIQICLSYHLFNLFVCKLLPQIYHHVPQLTGRDVAILVLIKHLESFFKLLLCIKYLHFLGHEVQELGELNGSIAICIHLVDHVLQFFL